MHIFQCILSLSLSAGELAVEAEREEMIRA